MRMPLHGRLIPVRMMGVGLQPKMLSYALNELFHVYCGMGVNDDGLCVAVQEMLSLTSLHCMECRGKPMPSSQTSGTASTMVDLNDELLLEWLAWVFMMVCWSWGIYPHSRDSMIGCGSWQERTSLFTKVVGPKTIVPPALHHPSALCELLGMPDNKGACHLNKGPHCNPQHHGHLWYGWL